MRDQDCPCGHEEFDAVVIVNRITNGESDSSPVGYSADIKVNCHSCGEPFRWTGVYAGLSAHVPMCSIDETELRAPLRPASADPDFGLGLPGFVVRTQGAYDIRQAWESATAPPPRAPGDDEGQAD
jgi:hypothetical protein